MSAMLAMDGHFSDKMRKNERTFILEKIEGKSAISSTGTVDNNLFTGDNNLRAIFNPETNMWSLKYDRGILPGAFLGHAFTQFSKLKSFVEEYYKKRNIKVKEIVD